MQKEKAPGGERIKSQGVEESQVIAHLKEVEKHQVRIQDSINKVVDVLVKNNLNAIECISVLCKSAQTIVPTVFSSKD